MIALNQLSLQEHGAQRFEGVLSLAEIKMLRVLAEGAGHIRSGKRIYRADRDMIRLLSAQGTIGAVAARFFGSPPRPVRVLMFDKTPESNWNLAWHQDRTVAVTERVEAPGFGPWSSKDGALHVAPPFGVLERMLTVRVHLDDCGADNSPLMIAVGSHRSGHIAATDVGDVAATHDRVACHALAGDIWVYSTPILHGSEPAAAPDHRRVLQVDYADFELPFGLNWLGLQPYTAESWTEENAEAIEDHRQRIDQYDVFGENLRRW